MSEPRRIEVKRCAGCPFSENFAVDFEYRCHAALASLTAIRGDAGERPALLSFGEMMDGPPPDWCPLRAAPVLVVLSEEAGRT